MTELIPITLRPVVRGMWNRWFHKSHSQSVLLRDGLATLICFSVMVLLYIATRNLLVKLDQLSEYVYLPSQYVLSFILLALFVMLFISNIVIASGAFFLSYDLDLLRKAPLSPLRFFLGRFIYTTILSSWMPFLFLFPCLVAFALFFKASFALYVTTVVLLIPYFVIASSVSYLLLLFVFSVTAPGRRVFLFWLLAALFIAMIVVFLRLISTADVSLHSAEDFARIVTILALPDYFWLPSYWVGTTLGYLLENRSIDSFAAVFLLYYTAIMLCSVTYIAHYFCFDRALAHAQAKTSKSRKKTAASDWLSSLFRAYSPQAFACFSREWTSVKRDLSYVVQAIMLFAVSIVYLYHLSIFRAVETLPDNIRMYWKQFLFVGHLCMSSFIVTAICTRFVFSSVSLEGRAYWLLQSSPLQSHKLLNYKFYFWFFPVTMLSTLFFTAGAIVVGSAWYVVVLNALVSVSTCYGLVGLGIGCGAYFAYFDWEYSSQLAASFGSLMYMVLCILIISLSLFPAGLVVWITGNVQYYSSLQVGISYLACALLLLSLHVGTKHVAMKLGAAALEAKKQS